VVQRTKFKETEMKTRFTVLLAMLGLIAAVAVPAYGQTVRLSGTIPFEFTVGNQTMPAGEYTLSRTSTVPGGWVISGPANRAGAFLVAGAGDRKNGGDAPRLAFSRYGDRYFLSQIWTISSDHVFRLRVSRTERAVAKANAARGTTTIAMR
jgi:hypothetical protein